MKLGEYRTKYFEDYVAREAVKKNGKKKIEYVYMGIWYRWGDEGFNKTRRGLVYLALELFSIALFMSAGFSISSLTTANITAGCCIVSLVPWIAEISGVGSFLISKEYMTELDCTGMEKRIIYGAALKIGVLLVGIVGGAAVCLKAGTFDGRSILHFCCFFLSGAISFVIAMMQHKLVWHKYHNHDGSVGSEY